MSNCEFCNLYEEIKGYNQRTLYDGRGDGYDYEYFVRFETQLFYDDGVERGCTSRIQYNPFRFNYCPVCGKQYKEVENDNKQGANESDS